MCFNHHPDPLSYDEIIATTRIRWSMPARQRLKEMFEDAESKHISPEKLKAQVEKLVYATTIRLGNAQGVIM